MTALSFLLLRRMQPALAPGEAAARWRQGWPLVVANAFAGPAIGVACYQWALKTTRSGIVLPIVATSPLVTMALTFFIDGQRPTLRAVIGGVVAVGGAVALNLVQG
jgi:drug/metabolite transporter (DMT)-like permease